MTVYEASYCNNVHESNYRALSIHRTKEGAMLAIEEHKKQLKKEWMFDFQEELEAGIKPYVEWNDFMLWTVFEHKLLD